MIDDDKCFIFVMVKPITILMRELSDVLLYEMLEKLDTFAGEIAI